IVLFVGLYGHFVVGLMFCQRLSAPPAAGKAKCGAARGATRGTLGGDARRPPEHIRTIARARCLTRPDGRDRGAVPCRPAMRVGAASLQRFRIPTPATCQSLI